VHWRRIGGRLAAYGHWTGQVASAYSDARNAAEIWTRV